MYKQVCVHVYAQQCVESYIICTKSLDVFYRLYPMKLFNHCINRFVYTILYMLFIHNNVKAAIEFVPNPYIYYIALYPKMYANYIAISYSRRVAFPYLPLAS